MSRIIKLLLFGLILLIFCYFRLKPLYFQTVGYTYDQGRDFLKAAEIITEKNITFIGPTTGIPGVFHGAWYFYLLTIPFLLFGGAPIGFYYFNFFVQFFSFILITYFLYRNFGFLIAGIISLLVASSPYFIFTSIFVGNNIFVMPIFLLFLLINYSIITSSKEQVAKLKSLFFINGLLLGFVAEFEVAFGLFLIPSYFILILLFGRLRSFFMNLKAARYFLTGLVIPFLPRIFFELKNNFFQIKSFINRVFFGVPESPKTYSGAFQERIDLFFGYYRSIFENDVLLLAFTLALILLVIFIFQQKIKKYDGSLNFFVPLFLFLFFLSTLYINNNFYVNYFEGIQYLILILIALGLSVVLKSKNYLLQFLKTALFLLVGYFVIASFISDIRTKPKTTGHLEAQTRIVRYIQSNVKKENKYCVKVYTPPVIPFTYNYLFLYERLSKKFPLPETDWVDDRCWFIIEKDDNQERQNKWIEEKIPRKNRVLIKNSIEETQILLYQIRE